METEPLSDEVLMSGCAGGTSTPSVRFMAATKFASSTSFSRFAGERALAEDLLQETFWRICKLLTLSNPARGGFRSWLYGCVNATRSEMALKRYSRETRQRRTRTS